MKNLCEECKYQNITRSHEGDYDCYCECGIEESASEDGCGCNYSEELLSLLQKYNDFEMVETHSYRDINEFEHATRLEEELKKKQENGEEIDYWDKARVSIAWKRYNEVKKFATEYMRCNYLRFFEKNDPKGKLRRHLKRKGQYPYWIHDLFYVEKEEAE